MQSIDSIDAYGMNINLVYKKKEIKHNNVVKQFENV